MADLSGSPNLTFCQGLIQSTPFCDPIHPHTHTYTYQTDTDADTDPDAAHTIISEGTVRAVGRATRDSVATAQPATEVAREI